MLVLTRKMGEGLSIGDSVVTVVKIKGKQVRIGVECHDDLKINRLNTAGQIEERNNAKENQSDAQNQVK